MINWVIRFCLERKLVVLVGVLLLVGAGLRAAPFDWDLGGYPRDPVPVDAIPDIGENQQIVFTKWSGRSPQDVEDQVTYPLTVALLGVPGVKTVRSYSYFGFSSIYIIFEEDIEFYWSRSRVLEKLASLPAGTLPPGVQPTLGPDATALGQVYWYTLEGRDPDGNPTGGWDLDELRTVQDWYVRYGLLSAEGVSEVASVGGHTREYQVDVDPDAMRAHGVTLTEVIDAVRKSNLDVGARTIEVNRAEYVVRGLGFIRQVSDLEQVVVRVGDHVPIRIQDVARVTLGPALRRGVLDKEGSEAVGGVVVVRHGHNPLAAIKNVKGKIDELGPGLPRKVLVDREQVSREEVEAFAREEGFEAYRNAELNQDEWVRWALKNPDRVPEWATLSQVTIVPFYDRTGLIHETLGTLSSALIEEILVCVIVVLVMVLHLRSSILISGLLPLAVLFCFVAMKLCGVEANVVALSGIAIAIGTIVDMGVIICENILRHLDEAPLGEPRLEVIYRAASEVGSAVVAAVATTIISFLPVFAMEAAEGKLFQPLAFTKTFALVGSIVVAITIIPPAAHLLFRREGQRTRWHAYVWPGAQVVLGLAALFLSVGVGLTILVLATCGLLKDRVSPRLDRALPWIGNGVVILLFVWLLTRHWLPLGPEQGTFLNLVFVVGLIGGVLGLLQLFLKIYPRLLRWCLDHKLLFLSLPALLIVGGLTVWLGPATLFGPLQAASVGEHQVEVLEHHKLIERRGDAIVWTETALRRDQDEMKATLDALEVENTDALLEDWSGAKARVELRVTPWDRVPEGSTVRWSIVRGWTGLGKEFMPPLDEGSYLYMPTTMPHASIGEAADVLAKLDMAMASVPEVEMVVGKLGRADSPLDPAPVSMIETVVTYKPEYVLDARGQRALFARDPETGEYARDDQGELIPDPNGVPFRQWRDHIRSPDDIWKALVEAGKLPGTTSAPKLQPIAARIVMLQSGMRAPMGIKIKGPDLETLERVGLQMERLLKQVPSVKAEAVFADRIVGKPYLEIEIDREAIARYGLKITTIQEIIEVAIGGKRLTTTVEGRERYPVRVRYARELRDSVEALAKIYVPTPDGQQIPLVQLAEIRFVRGPQVIKSEDTFLVAYVLFDKKEGYAEVDVVEECQAFLQAKIDSGELEIPAGVSYSFAGSYENQVRSQAKLRQILPLTFLLIVLLLYFQFGRISTTMMVFSAIIVAWSGGFLMLWLYGQPWFLDLSLGETNLRELFQVHPINLSVAVWVGFIAMFGIADDDGVVMATYLDQVFAERQVDTIERIREATLLAGGRRIRPCLMTTATTFLALIPVLTSTGRGSDIMVPMAIPAFGGMCVELLTLFVVPTLYCGLAEWRLGKSN